MILNKVKYIKLGNIYLFYIFIQYIFAIDILFFINKKLRPTQIRDKKMTKNNAKFNSFMNSLRGSELYGLILMYVEAKTGKEIDLCDTFAMNVNGAIEEIEYWVAQNTPEDE